MSSLSNPNSPTGEESVVVAVWAPTEAWVQELFFGLGFTVTQDSGWTIGHSHRDLVNVTLVHGPLDVSIGFDALLAVFDGDLGLAPELISVWHDALNHDLPRTLVAVNTATGRADFDEVHAIAERVLDGDIIARYVPVISDDESRYVALFDLIDQTLHVPTRIGINEQLADFQHRELTSDARENLIEVLAHASLSDDALATFTQGLPIDRRKLVDAWFSDETISLHAIDDTVGRYELSEWLAHRQNIWHPVVKADVEEPTQPIALTIAPHLARVFSADTSADISALIRAYGRAIAVVGNTDVEMTIKQASDQRTLHFPSH